MVMLAAIFFPAVGPMFISLLEYVSQFQISSLHWLKISGSKIKLFHKCFLKPQNIFVFEGFKDTEKFTHIVHNVTIKK